MTISVPFLALDNHVARMSMTEILMLYLVKSQEATNMLFNAKFYQMYVVDRVRDSKEPGFNGKL